MTIETIAVVGSGAMGRGIVQLFAQSGFRVQVYDAASGAVDSALTQLRSTFDSLVQKGRMQPDAASAAVAAIEPVSSLAALASAQVVIEAIVENLEVKKGLFAELESIVTEDCVLASNTSSLSVTAIAAVCRHPGRVAGYHFFNPVPLMKLAEVVRGVRTDEAVIEQLLALTARTGHTAVVCADTPGFIVNHAGRGYGTESLRALNEGVAPFHVIDRILRDQVDFEGRGFRMGPFELLDLTALDVSHPAMESIYHQFYEEPRFRPSVTTAQRLAAGLVGRKRGEGFYRYADGQQESIDEPVRPEAALRPVWVAPGAARAALVELVGRLDGSVDEAASPGPESIALVAPLGVDASTTAVELGLDARQVVAIDTLFPFSTGCKRRVLMVTPATDPAVAASAWALFGADGTRVSLLRDSAGFIAQRVVAMIVAIACEIAQQRIARPQDIDTAVRLGLGYPVGPLAMGDHLGAARVLEVLAGMHRVTGDPRYRPSLWLRRRAQLGLSLLAAD